MSLVTFLIAVPDRASSPWCKKRCSANRSSWWIAQHSQCHRPWRSPSAATQNHRGRGSRCQRVVDYHGIWRRALERNSDRPLWRTSLYRDAWLSPPSTSFQWRRATASPVFRKWSHGSMLVEAVCKYTHTFIQIIKIDIHYLFHSIGAIKVSKIIFNFNNWSFPYIF